MQTRRGRGRTSKPSRKRRRKRKNSTRRWTGPSHQEGSVQKNNSRHKMETIQMKLTVPHLATAKSKPKMGVAFASFTRVCKGTVVKSVISDFRSAL